MKLKSRVSPKVLELRPLSLLLKDKNPAYTVEGRPGSYMLAENLSGEYMTSVSDSTSVKERAEVISTTSTNVVGALASARADFSSSEETSYLSPENVRMEASTSVTCGLGNSVETSRIHFADESSWMMTSSDLLEDAENLGTAELKEPWQWGDDVSVAETMDMSTRGPAGQNLVEILHVTAQKMQKDLFKQEPLAPSPWYTPRWLGLDRNFWLCTLGYQGAVLALLKASMEIAKGLLERDSRVTKEVTESFVRQCDPLEAEIHRTLGTKGHDVEMWFIHISSCEAVADLEFLLEKDPFFKIGSYGDLGCLGDADIVTMALHVQGAILHLGPEAIAHSAFFSLAQEETRTLLSLLAKLLPVNVVYARASRAGLRREFLMAFGERAALREEVGPRDVKKMRRTTESQKDGEVRAFWVQSIEQLLQAAMVREGVFIDWRRTEMHKQALKEDLAIFGFFLALGQTTRTYLAFKGAADADEAVAVFLRYLEGACVLFFPDLSNLLRYQLFVDVVREELSWLPFYPGVTLSRRDLTEPLRVSKREKRMAIITAERTCARWLQEFAQHSVWVKGRPNSTAGKLLNGSWRSLCKCVRTHEKGKTPNPQDNPGSEIQETEERESMMELVEVEDGQWRLRRWERRRRAMEKQLDKMRLMEEDIAKMEKEVMAVEDVVRHLDNMVVTSDRHQQVLVMRDEVAKLMQLHDRASQMIRAIREEIIAAEEDLRVACDVKETLAEADKEDGRRRIGLNVRRPKSIGNAVLLPGSSSRGYRIKSFKVPREQTLGCPGKFWHLRWGSGHRQGLVRTRSRKEWATLLQREEGKEEGDEGDVDVMEDAQVWEETLLQMNSIRGELDATAALLCRQAPDIILRLPLGKVVSAIAQRVLTRGLEEEGAVNSELSECFEMVELPKKKNCFMSKSIEALKESSAAAWRGTQLLSADVAAALAMVQRWAAGQRLTLRQKKILRRTIRDLAAVIPISILMLLPLTPIGHGAVITAIQKWFPGLIPSSFCADRLNVARQLEQVRILASEPVVLQSQELESALDEATADAHTLGSSEDEEVKGDQVCLIMENIN